MIKPVPDIQPEVTPKTVLEAALEDVDNYRNILVITLSKDGQTTIRTSTQWGPDVLWMMQKAKHIILDQTS